MGERRRHEPPLARVTSGRRASKLHSWRRAAGTGGGWPRGAQDGRRKRDKERRREKEGERKGCKLSLVCLLKDQYLQSVWECGRARSGIVNARRRLRPPASLLPLAAPQRPAALLPHALFRICMWRWSGSSDIDVCPASRQLLRTYSDISVASIMHARCRPTRTHHAWRAASLTGHSPPPKHSL